jgi:hypothetical protein
MEKNNDDKYSAEEAQQRVEKALRAAFAIPPKPQSEMRLGKRRTTPNRSPNKRKPVKKPGR